MIRNFITLQVTLEFDNTQVDADEVRKAVEQAIEASLHPVFHTMEEVFVRLMET